MATMVPTNVVMANRGNTVTASNTVAATTLAVSIQNNGFGVTSTNSAGGNVLMVAAIAIFTAGVTVSSITPGANLFVGWTFQGATSEPGSGVRIELWTVPCVTGGGVVNSTINFSGSALASASVSSYTQPYDYASSPLVNSGLYNNTNGLTTGVHNETISPAAFTAGSLILLTVAQSSTTNSISSITDSVGTTYTLANSGVYSAFGANFGLFVYAGIAGGSDPSPTVTIHWSANSAMFRYYLSQWTGVTTVVDGTAFAGVPAIGGGAMNTLNVTTTNANNLIHAVLGLFQFPTVLSQAPGYCIAGSFEGGRVVTSTGTYPTYWTNNNSSAGMVTGFKVSPTYTPTAPPTPNIVTAHSALNTGFYAEVDNTPQTGGSMIVTAYAVATTSGDTFASANGTLRAAVTPTVTSAAAVLMENGPEYGVDGMRTQLRMSAQRAWAAISFELVAGNGTALPHTPLVLKSSSGGFGFDDAHQLKSPQAPENFKVPVVVVTASPLTLSAQQLKGGVIPLAYTETLTATGGTAPYTFTVISGSLPPGLSLAPATGIISGTPTTANTYNFTVKVADSGGNVGTGTFQITTDYPASGGSYVFGS